MPILARFPSLYLTCPSFPFFQMLDVHLPTTDGRSIILSRYTQPEPELQLLIKELKLRLPDQPPPKIAASGRPVE
jgi:hypothetical protein